MLSRLLSSLTVALTVIAATLPACKDDDGTDGGSGDGTADDSADDGGDDGTADGGDDGGTSGGTGDDGNTGDDGGTGDGGTASGDDTGEDGPHPTDLPEPQGECPDFVDGTITVQPSVGARDVRLWISSAADNLDGPLVFYWHGTGSSPQEVQWGLGSSTVDAILDMGGMVVAPTSDPDSGQWPWFLVSGNREDDLLVADEVLACAIEKVGVDTRRIHTLGMSAGGLHTAQMSLRRSNYIASAVPYSGGIIYGNPPNADPSNKFAAMIFHGGETDVVAGADFEDASNNYRDILTQNGNFAFICNHGEGHTIPQDALPSVWQFLQDHPFGTDPPPYAGGLPQGFPTYCTL
jgi:poly(3-hydroxybutyrate) depolymerase